MTKEEAIAYFTKCNEDIISVCKDENVYNYEKQEIEAVYLRRTFEANCMAISALKPTRMIDESNFSREQYKADLQSAYDCGKAESLVSGWIPIEERPPEIEGRYVVTVNHGNGEYVTTAIFNYLYEKWWSDSQVIAWREDIEPYKKGE